MLVSDQKEKTEARIMRTGLFIRELVVDKTTHYSHSIIQKKTRKYNLRAVDRSTVIKRKREYQTTTKIFKQILISPQE